jgi:hypothetical protein
VCATSTNRKVHIDAKVHDLPPHGRGDVGYIRKERHRHPPHVSARDAFLRRQVTLPLPWVAPHEAYRTSSERSRLTGAMGLRVPVCRVALGSCDLMARIIYLLGPDGREPSWGACLRNLTTIRSGTAPVTLPAAARGADGR